MGCKVEGSGIPHGDSGGLRLGPGSREFRVWGWVLKGLGGCP